MKEEPNRAKIMFESSLEAENSEQISQNESTVSNSQRTFKVYPYRYVIAWLFAGVSIVNQMFWVTTTPITTQIVNIYDISVFTVNMTSLVYLFLYVPTNFPSNWLLDEKGLRYGIVLGAALTLVGAWFRIGAISSYYYVIFGQFVGALGQPLILNAPQKISAVWFPPESRSMVTTLLSVSAPVGVAFGILVPGFVIPEKLTVEDGKSAIMYLMILEGVIASLVLIPTILFFRDKPPTPPSASSEIQRPDYIQSLKQILSNKSYLFLATGAGLCISTSSTIATVSEQLLAPFNYTQYDITIFGAMLIAAGLLGSIVFVLYVKKTRAYKRVLCMNTILGTTFFILTMGGISTGSFWAVLITSTLLGFTAAPGLPIALEFACELTFPAGEASAGGFIISMSQLASGIEVVIMDLVLASEENWKGSAYSGLLMTCLLIISVICTLLIKERLVRTEHDDNYMLTMNHAVNELPNGKIPEQDRTHPLITT